MGLYNVLYVPEIAKNLVSVSAMTGKGAEVLFENNKCYVTKDQKTMNIGHLANSNLYVINTEPDFANVASSKASLEVWHCRFGHINYKYVNELSQKKMVVGMNCSKEDTNQQCEACAKAKMHKGGFRQKLDPKSEKGILVGYPLDTKGYKIYNIESKKFIRSKDVLFHENKFHNFQSSVEKNILFKFEDDFVTQKDKTQTNVQVEPVIPVELENEEHIPAVGVAQPGASYEENFMRQVDTVGAKRIRKPPKRFSPDECNVAAQFTVDDDEPKSVTDALNSKNSGKWMQTLEAEYNSLVKSETWELVIPPDDACIVGSKWVFKVKRKANGEVDRYKALLVAQGYSQTYGIDYEEVFSPVARYSSIRTLLTLANAHDLEIYQMDVTTAFLNGSLEHDIYMKQPERFNDPKYPDHVCKLKRSIYGLKQSARCWNQTLDVFLLKNGYRKSNADSCIYVKSVKQENGFISFVILAVYVDDIIPVSNDPEMLASEKQLLSNEFQMVDQGEIQFILGMSIKRDRQKKTLFISQEKYLENVLNRFGMQDSKPVSTPLENGKTFHKRTNDEKPFDKETYQQAIGCLTYVSTATRPDIAAAVGILSQYMADPSYDHWLGIKRLLRYIKGTLIYGLKQGLF